MQGLRIVLFLVLPVASGIAAMVGARRKLAPVGFKRDALAYGPVVGVGLSLAAFVAVMALSIANGH
jgi:hypothetical protein